MSTCCCCCCCWDADGVPDDSPRITGGPGCSGPPPLCIFLPGAAADRNHLSSFRQISHVSHTSCCSSIIVRLLNAAAWLLELAALQGTAGDMATHHHKFNPVPIGFFLFQPDQSRKIKRKRGLAGSAAAAATKYRLSKCQKVSGHRRGFRGELFAARSAAPHALSGFGSNFRTLATRRANFSRPISAQIDAKNSKNRTFFTTLGLVPADDFDRLTSLSRNSSHHRFGYVKYATLLQRAKRSVSTVKTLPRPNSKNRTRPLKPPKIVQFRSG